MIRPAASLTLAAALCAPVGAHAGCGTCEADTAHPEDLASAIAAAHGGEAWSSHEAVSADFELDFPGMFSWTGTIIFDTPAGRSTIVLDDGTRIIHDGETVSVFPADAELPLPMARFHSLTWPYFVAAPFKLGDPGATLHDPEPQPWADGALRDAQQLTFDDGVGDAPDDWYYVFADEKHRLRGMSYIVTFGQDKGEAEKSQSAIVYKGYTEVGGALLSTEWDFYHWSKDDGLGEQKATGRLSDVRFVEIDDDTFAHPEGARTE